MESRLSPETHPHLQSKALGFRVRKHDRIWCGATTIAIREDNDGQ